MNFIRAITSWCLADVDLWKMALWKCCVSCTHKKSAGCIWLDRNRSHCFIAYCYEICLSGIAGINNRPRHFRRHTKSHCCWQNSQVLEYCRRTWMGSCFDCSKNNHIFSPSSLPGRRFKEKKNIKCSDFVVGLPLFSISLALFKIRFIYGTGESSFFFFNFSQPLQKAL